MTTTRPVHRVLTGLVCALLTALALLGASPGTAAAADPQRFRVDFSSGGSIDPADELGWHGGYVSARVISDGGIDPDKSWIEVVGKARYPVWNGAEVWLVPEATGPMTVEWNLVGVDGTVERGSRQFKVDVTWPQVTWETPDGEDVPTYPLGAVVKPQLSCSDVDMAILHCKPWPDSLTQDGTLRTDREGCFFVRGYAVTEKWWWVSQKAMYCVRDGSGEEPEQPEPEPAQPTVAAAQLEKESYGPDEHPVVLASMQAEDGTEVTGRVDVIADGEVIATGRAQAGDAGRARVVLPTQEIGTHELTVEYGGTGNFEWSPAGRLSLKVQWQASVTPLPDPVEVELGDSARFDVELANPGGLRVAGRLDVVDLDGAVVSSQPVDVASGSTVPVSLPPQGSPTTFDVRLRASGDVSDAQEWVYVDTRDWVESGRDSYRVGRDRTLEAEAPGVLRNDEEGDEGGWYTELAVPAAHGLVTMRADGGFAYTPYDGYTGSDRFAYWGRHDGRRTKTTWVDVEVGADWLKDVKLETQRYPSTEWTAVDGGDGVTAGDPLRAAITLENPGDLPEEVTVEVVDTETMRTVDNGRFTTVLSPGVNSPDHVDVPTHDLAYVREGDQAGEPALDPHRFRVRVTPTGEGTVRRDVSVRVDPRPVVTVHGYKSNANDSWGAFGDPESFGELVKAVHPAITTWVVGDGRAEGVMDTGSTAGLKDWSITTNLISGNAAEEARYIEDVRRQTGASHVDLVVHSMGGLISRHYIQELMPASVDDHPVVTRLVQLGTPNMGSPCADLLLAAGQVSDDGAVPLMPATLQLSTSWIGRVFNPTTTDLKGVPVSNLVGTDIKVACGPGQSGDGVVPDWSARWTLPEADRPEKIIEHTHMPTSQNVVEEYVAERLTRRVVTPAAARRTAVAASTAPALPPVFDQHHVDVPAGGTATVSLPVPDGDEVGVVAAGSGLGVELVDGSGTVRDGFDAADARAGGPFLGLRAADVAAGSWTVRLTNPGPTGVRVPLVAWVDGNPLQVSVDRAVLNGTGGADVRVRIADAGGPVRGAEVTATAAGTALAAGSTTLHDDGAHGDGAAGDGVYGGTIAAGTVARVTGSGADQGLGVVVRVASSAGDRVVSQAVVPQELAEPEEPEQPEEPTPATTITGQPVGVALPVGAVGELRVAATGKALHYRWEKRGPRGTWTQVGGDEPRLALRPTRLADGGRFRVVVSGAGGTVTSAEATVTVRRAVVALALSGPEVVAAGSRVEVRVTATSDGALPTGRVQVLSGDQLVGAVLLDGSGTGTARLRRLPEGVYRLVASRKRTAATEAATSEALEVRVGR